MKQQSENLPPTPAPTVIASCDDASHIRSTGAEVAVRAHRAMMSDPALTSGIGTASRVYLALENMRGGFDATVLRIHTGAEISLGSVALYGLRSASLPGPDRAGAGLTSHLDITPQAQAIVATLRAANQLQISIRPHNELPEGVEILIERIRIYIETVGHPPH